MPYQPQRFLHAANVRLDVPVSVHLSEQLTEDLRHALEDATLTSFDTVIDLCLSRSVDYLLLSGNLFVESDRSLRARLKLLEGFRRLQAKRIPVFVLTGDTDPPEAWRAIPELPENVTVCYSSNPEPAVLERDGRAITTVTASMWYGETDAFGIRVIGRSEDGLEPFRIGIVSRAKYDETQRMASLTSAEGNELLPTAVTLDLAEDNSAQPAGKVAEPTRQPQSEPDAESESQTQAVAEAADSASKPDKQTRSREISPAVRWSEPKVPEPQDYEAGFRRYVDQLMSEGRLNYVALGGELERSTTKLRSGMMHCPGTTQPRNQLEAEFGVCTLTEVDAEGHVKLTEFDTSAVDWKNIRLSVSPSTELNELLQEMRELLLDEPVDASDRIWSVRWTLSGPLPVLQEFLEDDVELAVAVELEELLTAGQKVRLVHQVRLLPDAWEVPDPADLGRQFADQILEEEVHRSALLSCLENSAELTEGWKHRFESLVGGVDRERILAQLRIDGAEWFVPDLNSLLPEPEPEFTDEDVADADDTAAVATEAEADEADEADEEADSALQPRPAQVAAQASGGNPVPSADDDTE